MQKKKKGIIKFKQNLQEKIDELKTEIEELKTEIISSMAGRQIQ